MESKPFKETVKEKMIEYSHDYVANLVAYRYLIYSDKFLINKGYTISAEEDNNLHLTGVSTSLSAEDFFKKCQNATLSCNDFSLGSGRNKGSIRRKIAVLGHATQIFTQSRLFIEENYRKNHIYCTFISSDGSCTLGFVMAKNAKPKTLMKGNMIKHPIESDLVLKIASDQSYQVLINRPAFEPADIEQIFLTYQ